MKSRLIRRSYHAVEIMMFALIAFFLLHSIISLFSDNLGQLIFQYFSFSPNGLSKLFIWTPITYTFIHDGPFHLIMNLIGLFFIGKAVEVEIGKSYFWYLSLFSGILGCLFWSIFNSHGESLVGASSIVLGCLSYFCLKNPNNSITLLLFFILPCRIKPKLILICVLCLDMYGFIFSELQNTSSVAHSAHLGGLFAGACFYIYLKSGKSLPVFVFKKRTRTTINTPTPSKDGFQVNFTNSSDLQIEVDRILDKINDTGFGSLTSKEKLTLEKAKSLL